MKPLIIALALLGTATVFAGERIGQTDDYRLGQQASNYEAKADKAWTRGSR